MGLYPYILRECIEKVGVKPLKQVALQPGLTEVYRVTIHYLDARASDTVTTLKRLGKTETVLEVIYQGHFDHKPLVYYPPLERYEAFSRAMRSIAFDTLTDQPFLPFFGIDICMVERGAGSFVKSVIFSPQRAQGVYLVLQDAIRSYLPESQREIEP